MCGVDMHAFESFDDFISPLGRQAFLEEYFGTKPVHVRGEPDRFAHLLSWDELNRILGYPLAMIRPRLAKQGKVMTIENFSRRVSVPDRPGEEKLVLHLGTLHREVAGGAMLAINGLEWLHPPISRLSQVLEEVLGGYVDGDVFVGWCDTPGFNTHWDQQDVFIAQVEGRKWWRVRRPQRLHPVQRDRALKHEPPAEIHWEGELRPGDVLYLPRGWWHDASPMGEPTLHVSLGATPPTGLDFARSALKRLVDSELARANVPSYRQGFDGVEHARRLAEEMAGLMSAAALAAFLEDEQNNTMARLRPSLPWAAEPDKPLPEHAWLRWTPSRRVDIQVREGQAIVEAMGSTFSFLEVAAPVLREFEKSRVISLREMCDRFPDTAVEPFVRQLVGVGLLSISLQCV